MPKKKYILPKGVRIVSSKTKGQTAFFVEKEESSKSYQINKQIASLLQKFGVEKTIKEGLLEEYPDADLSIPEVREPLIELFKGFLKIGALEEAKSKKKDSPQRFQNGGRFYGYQVEELLSSNSKIEVYRVIDTKVGCKYVMKALKKDALSTKRLKKHRTLLRNEFDIISSINHPYVYKIIKYYPRSDLGIMEYIEGFSLHDFIVKSKRTNSTKLRLIDQIIDCFSYLHKEQIQHGDIHLRNFMVNTHKQLRVIDFGYANSDSHSNNIHGGIPQYMPPERVKEHNFSFSKQKGDNCSEVFQLAILIYFIIYEKYPFQGFLWKDVAHQILNKEITSVNFDSPPFLSGRQEEVILKCFEKKPSDRYPNACSLKLDWQNA
ncbi:MAG: protein kinase [Cyclobacteriaceae bacterium]